MLAISHTAAITKASSTPNTMHPISEIQAIIAALQHNAHAKPKSRAVSEGIKLLRKSLRHFPFFRLDYGCASSGVNYDGSVMLSTVYGDRMLTIEFFEESCSVIEYSKVENEALVIDCFEDEWEVYDDSLITLPYAGNMTAKLLARLQDFRA